MSSTITIAGIEIPQADWDATPESVKLLVTVLSERLAYVEQLKQNSQNSLRPPSLEEAFLLPFVIPDGFAV